MLSQMLTAYKEIDRLSSLIKERRSLDGVCSADLWLPDIYYLTEKEMIELHELKLGLIDNDSCSARIRIEDRILNKKRGRNDTGTTMQKVRF